MKRINVLDSSIFNKISAGEVVERPASVVKELIENSIDAGADDITVEIAGGGLKSIKITDNGTGIMGDDVEKAFLPHATSKISDAEDLFKISTLGFRGEALASIAAVSMVSIKTKTDDGEIGWEAEIKGGILLSKKPCAGNRGTVIEVSNLFFNTPARLKFMKSPRTEESEIKTVFSNIMLANPFISMRFVTEKGVSVESLGGGMVDAIAGIYGRETAEMLLPVEYDRHGVKITGYVGKPSLTKSNRSYQTIIVNGRTVGDKNISVAVQKAYGERLMSRAFPVFVLDIVLPFNDVDVNVHPAKAEVRFKDSGLIFGAVFSAVSRALDGGAIDLIPEIKLDIPDIILNNDTARETAADKYCTPIKDSSENKRTSLDMSSIRSTFKGASGVKESSGITSAEIIARLSHKSELKEESTVFSEDFLEAEQIKYDMPNLIDYKIVGQLFDTYLLLEYKGEALMIDQHAAMERINYDRLIAFIEKEGSIQNLLVPYILNVNHYENALIEDNIEGFKEIGVEIEPFGNNTYRVSAIPAALGNINLERFFKLAIGEINSGKGLKMNEILRDKLAQAACKASIKGGDKLNDEKIKLLLQNMNDGKIPLQCPHGRPAVIRLTRSELEKWFKRTL